MDKAMMYMKERAPEVTIFEGSATSDPLPIEPYTHVLEKTIKFFALNTHKVISEYENRTVSIKLRLEASQKIAKAEYPLGFIIAPVFLYEG